MKNTSKRGTSVAKKLNSFPAAWLVTRIAVESTTKNHVLVLVLLLTPSFVLINKISPLGFVSNDDLALCVELFFSTKMA